MYWIACFNSSTEQNSCPSKCNLFRWNITISIGTKWEEYCECLRLGWLWYQVLSVGGPEKECAKVYPKINVFCIFVFKLMMIMMNFIIIIITFLFIYLSFYTLIFKQMREKRLNILNSHDESVIDNFLPQPSLSARVLLYSANRFCHLQTNCLETFNVHSRFCIILSIYWGDIVQHRIWKLCVSVVCSDAIK